MTEEPIPIYSPNQIESPLRLSSFYSLKRRYSDRYYQDSTIRKALERQARKKHKNTQSVFSTLEQIVNGKIIKEAFPNQNVPSEYLALKEKIRIDAIGNYIIQRVKEMKKFLGIEKDRIVDESILNQFKILQNFFRNEVVNERPDLIDFIYEDEYDLYVREGEIWKTINNITETELGANRNLNYYLSFMVISHMLCRKSEEMEKAGDLTQAQVDLEEASIMCVLAEEHEAENYHKDFRQEIARAGGLAKANTYNELHKFLAELIKKYAPEGGWKSKDQVINDPISIVKNGKREITSISYLLEVERDRLEKEKKHPENFQTQPKPTKKEMRMDGTIRSWLNKEPIVVEAFEESRAKKTSK